MHIITNNIAAECVMCRLVGYTLFWVAIGMLFMLVIGNVWIGLILVAIFAVSGYYLFSCK